MRARKEKQYLIFEFDDGKDVKFDLSDGQFIGKKGKPVKGLTGQLCGYSIQEVIDSFEDEKYRKFLNHIYSITIEKSWGWTSYSNVGTFLNHVRKYLNLEQFYACGFTNIDLRSRSLKMSDVPKKLIKICRERDIRLTEDILRTYKEDQNMWSMLLESEFEMLNISEMMNYRYRPLENFMNLVNTYKYKPKSLATYIDNIMRFEGENSRDNVITLLHDYTRMMSDISQKYEKYPRYLATTHNIAVRNFNRLKKEFHEETFKSRIKESMEYTYKGWCIIYPKATQDIKDEAVQQNNCVASYIDRVIDGECDILFMRNKEMPNKSVVTLEVRNGKVVQAKGKFNRDCNEEEKQIIKKYEEVLAC